MSTRRFYSCGREGDEGGEELTLPSRNDVLSLTLFRLSTFPLFRMIFHNVSDSGPTGSASSWISDIFSLPSLPTSILNSLTSSSSPTSSTFPPSASTSGFKWGFGSSSSQGREEVKRPGQEGDLRVEDRESFRFFTGGGTRSSSAGEGSRQPFRIFPLVFKLEGGRFLRHEGFPSRKALPS